METTLSMAEEVLIPLGRLSLKGLLTIPQAAKGMVIFVHGSGSSRLSSRNQHVAQTLNEARFATLLFDLLTEKEEALDMQTAEYRFNIPLLTERLLIVTEWTKDHSSISDLPKSYFGASTGAAAALCAAALNSHIAAVVSRGGRADLAFDALPAVKSPTLLIVGGNDSEVIKLNQFAFDQLKCIKHLEIVPGATHLFEEPGKLAKVAELATNWLDTYLNFKKTL